MKFKVFNKAQSPESWFHSLNTWLLSMLFPLPGRLSLPHLSFAYGTSPHPSGPSTDGTSSGKSFLTTESGLSASSSVFC